MSSQRAVAIIILVSQPQGTPFILLLQGKLLGIWFPSFPPGIFFYFFHFLPAEKWERVKCSPKAQRLFITVWFINVLHGHPGMLACTTCLQIRPWYLVLQQGVPVQQPSPGSWISGRLHHPWRFFSSECLLMYAYVDIWCLDEHSLLCFGTCDWACHLLQVNLCCVSLVGRRQ